jgi:hypothetical protein
LQEVYVLLTHHCLILFIPVKVDYQLTLVVSLHVLVGASSTGEVRKEGGIVVFGLEGVREVNRLSAPVPGRNDFIGGIEVLRLSVAVMGGDRLLLGRERLGTADKRVFESLESALRDRRVLRSVRVVFRGTFAVRRSHCGWDLERLDQLVVRFF